MRFPFAVLGSTLALAVGLLAASPADAGWKWKKMRWEPKHGQYHRPPYAEPVPGFGRHGYGGYGGGRYNHDRYGDGRYGSRIPYGYGGPAYGARRGLDW